MDENELDFETKAILKVNWEEKLDKKRLAAMDEEAVNLRIEELYLRGKNAKEIREEIGISSARLAKGLVAIREKWVKQTDSGSLRDRLMAEMREVKRRAWEIIEEEGSRNNDKVHSLKIIIEGTVVEGKLGGVMTETTSGALRDEHVKKMWEILQSSDKVQLPIIEATVREVINDDGLKERDGDSKS